MSRRRNWPSNKPKDAGPPKAPWFEKGRAPEPVIPRIVVQARQEPGYCPACPHCRPRRKMTKAAPYLWMCLCGAVEDHQAAARKIGYI